MIHRLTIRDFKSIRKQTVEFDPLTVFVGRSGSGKSNIVQALRFLRNYLLTISSAVEVEGGWQRIVPAGIECPSLELTVEFSISNGDPHYTYFICFGSDRGQTFAQEKSLQVIEERLSFGESPLFHRQLEDRKWKWTVEPSTVIVPDPARHLAIQQLPSIEQVTYAYTALTNGLGFHSFATSVMDGLHANEVQGQKAISQHLAGMHDDGQNYLQTMRDIARDLHQPQVRKSILGSLQKLNPNIRSVELDSITQPKTAIVGHDLSGKILDIPLEQESDGLRRFYAHLLALYQRPPKLINVFEEPENAIYPGALSVLADEFKLAPEHGRGQIILTTHSPGLLDEFDVSQIRVVELIDGTTVVGPVAREQQEAVGDHLLTTGELLTVERPRLDPEQGTAGAVHR